MTLTVVVGSSGSGKTTFLNDAHKRNKCTYIRQYHNLRPYIEVRKIPGFDPEALPFWPIYRKENPKIRIGGTMAGQFTAGLSGGQRKLLLFELIYQRTKSSSDLLIVLDEPFAGVTEDFVPFIVERLNAMRQTHNILLVTNDHVGTLTDMADNTLTVSAVDREHVKVNARMKVDREVSLLAVSSGKDYVHTAASADIRFFMDVEVFGSQTIKGIAAYTIFAMSSKALFPCQDLNNVVK
jgi:ABC-type lipoprotein export system ATPase subunit